MENDDQIPDVGWKVKLDYVFPEKRKQGLDVTFKQAIAMIPLCLRYIWYYICNLIHGTSPVMDFIKVINSDQKSGVPLGGIGGGTIGRGFRGEFCRYQMIPGFYEYYTSYATQFILTVQDENETTIYQKVLSCQGKPKGKKLSSWDWDFPAADAEYTALYPQAWTVFNVKEVNIILICRQISPVIPHNYKDSSIPGAVFEWIVYNNNSSKRFVSISFTIKNGTGCKHDSKGNPESEKFEQKEDEFFTKGISIKQFIGGLPCCYSVATQETTDSKVSHCLYFNPEGNGSSVWDELKKNGEFQEKSHSKHCGNKELAAGLCCKKCVEGNNKTCMTFSFVWDMPKVRFHGNPNWKRRYYTKYFGDTCNAGPELSLYCLRNYPTWKSSILQWQNNIIMNQKLPDWFKSALFNELYYIADGGTLWLCVDDSEAATFKQNDPRIKYGRFAYLEGHEYRMYNTYDVHFYASFALAMLWPQLQKSLQYDLRDSVDREDKTLIYYLYNGQRAYRKTRDTVPHDIGDPGSDPFVLINSYPIHDVSRWRDLNLKFVLQVYRDYTIFEDLDYLKDMFPQVVTVMNYSLNWDKDDDGLIENSGTPDQTYDTWIMSGNSAYCGGLWLAAVAVFVKMAKIMDDESLADKYFSILRKGKNSYDQKLFNGSYYKFDTSGGSHADSIMADQLCGLWYLLCSGVEDDVFDPGHVKTALQTIFNFNVNKYFDGQYGAVNGMMPNGEVDEFSTQSQEVWTGVTYSLASLLIFKGFIKEGFTTAKGIYETCFNKSGLGFATPEAFFKDKSYRSLGYMRPLSIWSILLALEKLGFPDY